MSLLFIAGTCNTEIDLLFFGLVVAGYFALWYLVPCFTDEEIGYIDVDIYIESVKSGLTATSILLPGTFVAANFVGRKMVEMSHVNTAAGWFFLSIIAGIVNLARLPTIVGSKEKDQKDIIAIRDLSAGLFGVVQLSGIILGSLRVLCAFAT